VRTLFVGAGATGGYFGGRLAEAGKDVTFLVRPGRRAVLDQRGLRIKGPGGETVSHPKLITAETVDGPYDLVVLSVKSYALEQAMIDMTPAIGPRTVIVPLLNGIRHVDELAGAFGTERAWGGVCLVEATVDRDGDIVQMSSLHRIGYGPLDGGQDERLPEVTFALSGEEFDTNPSHTIVQDMWEKWIFLATMAGLTTLMRASLGDLNAAPGGPDLAARMAGEAIAIAAAGLSRCCGATSPPPRREPPRCTGTWRRAGRSRPTRFWATCWPTEPSTTSRRRCCPRRTRICASTPPSGPAEGIDQRATGQSCRCRRPDR
jgi:2-dehydropantoate 2-reductase